MRGQPEVIVRVSDARVVWLPINGAVPSHLARLPHAIVRLGDKYRLVVVEKMRRDMMGAESWDLEWSAEKAAEAALSAVAGLLTMRDVPEPEGGAA